MNESMMKMNGVLVLDHEAGVPSQKNEDEKDDFDQDEAMP